jgi:hypothetical protein
LPNGYLWASWVLTALRYSDRRGSQVTAKGYRWWIRKPPINVSACGASVGWDNEKEQYTLTAMKWNIKRISAYRRSASLAMAIVMSVHMLSVPGLYCAKGVFPPFRSLVTGLVGLSLTPPEDGGVEVAGTDRDNPQSQRGSSNCNCKKQKKCPAIPRAVITSNPTYRFNGVQRQAKSACLDSFVCQVPDHRFASAENRLLVKLACCSPFFCSNPLALTSVLLI